MGVEVALLTAVNPALLSNTAIADTAGEDPVTVLGLGNQAREEKSEGMRVVVAPHRMRQLSTSDMEIVGAGGAVITKGRAGFTASIADEVLLGVRRRIEECEVVVQVGSVVELLRQAEAGAVEEELASGLGAPVSGTRGEIPLTPRAHPETLISFSNLERMEGMVMAEMFEHFHLCNWQTIFQGGIVEVFS